MDNASQNNTETAEPIAHGDPENGFIVEHHDGERHLVHACQAGSEDEAISAAKREWGKPAANDGRGGDDHERDEHVRRGDEVKALRERVAKLETKLEDHERKFDALHDALAKISEPVAEAVEDPPKPIDGASTHADPGPDDRTDYERQMA